MSEAQPNELVLLSKAHAALAQARTVDDIKKIRDQAEAVRMYIKQQNMGLNLQNAAAEIRIRAERKAGEMLSVMPKRHGARDGKTGLHDVTPLADLGIEKIDSHRWQKVAAVPDEVFENHIQKSNEDKKELTTASVLRLTVKPKKTHNTEPDLGDLVFELHEKVLALAEKWADEYRPVMAKHLRELADRIEKDASLEEVRHAS